MDIRYDRPDGKQEFYIKMKLLLVPDNEVAIWEPSSWDWRTLLDLSSEETCDIEVVSRRDYYKELYQDDD